MCYWFCIVSEIFDQRFGGDGLTESRVVAFYLIGFMSTLPPTITPWVNIVMKDDAEATTVTTGVMISIASAVNAFFPITVFPVLQGTYCQFTNSMYAI
jgi:hypothetical protein